VIFGQKMAKEMRVLLRVMKKLGCGPRRETQGLKPAANKVLSARLKSCPDTRREFSASSIAFGEVPFEYIFWVTGKVVAAGYNPRSLRGNPRFLDAILCPMYFAADGFVWCCLLLHVGSGAGD
jgi:hypothetical protein